MGATSRTWNARFADTLKTLGVAEGQCDSLMRAHAEIAQEWGDLPVVDLPPFPSGVCPDGSPVEVSLQFQRRGQAQARFIAQPFDPKLPADQQAAWAAKRVLDFAGHWADAQSVSRLREALRIYPQDADPSFVGNFWFWLGLATNDSGAHAAKVYFNPWACKTEYRGGFALHHLLKCAGMDTGVLRILKEWVDPQIGAMPHIVGWNLVNDRVSSVKLYVQGSFDLRVLRQLDQGKDSFEPAWTKLFRCGIPMRPRGAVHLALVCRSESEPVSRLNFYCPDWFRSDDDALGALKALLSQWPTDTFDTVAQVCMHNVSPRRAINFIGVDEEVATVYLNEA